MKKTKTLCILFCIALIAVLSACSKDEGIHGTYRSVDSNNDSLWFDYASKVQVNLDGEILEGTYKISGDAIVITIDNSPKLIILTIVDKDSLLRRHSGLQVFVRK